MSEIGKTKHSGINEAVSLRQNSRSGILEKPNKANEAMRNSRKSESGRKDDARREKDGIDGITENPRSAARLSVNGSINGR